MKKSKKSEHDDILLLGLQTVDSIIQNESSYQMSENDSSVIEVFACHDLTDYIRSKFENPDLDFEEKSVEYVCENTFKVLQLVRFDFSGVDARLIALYLSYCIWLRTECKFIRKPKQDVMPVFEKTLNKSEKNMLANLPVGTNTKEIVFSNLGHYDDGVYDRLPKGKELCPGHSNVPVESPLYWIEAAVTSMSAATPTLFEYYQRYVHAINIEKAIRQ